MFREIKSILKEDKLSYAGRLEAIERLLATIPANYESRALDFNVFQEANQLHHNEQPRPSRSLRQPKNRGQLEQPTIEVAKRVVVASTREQNSAIVTNTNTTSSLGPESHEEGDLQAELAVGKPERPQNWEKVVESKKKMIEMHAF